MQVRKSSNNDRDHKLSSCRSFSRELGGAWKNSHSKPNEFSYCVAKCLPIVFKRSEVYLEHKDWCYSIPSLSEVTPWKKNHIFQAQKCTFKNWCCLFKKAMKPSRFVTTLYDPREHLHWKARVMTRYLGGKMCFSSLASITKGSDFTATTPTTRRGFYVHPISLK